MFIAGHWAEGAPFLTHDEATIGRSESWPMSAATSISCGCTLRPSTIADPLYGYDAACESECAFDAPSAITVMAVDNLPCELPRDASHGFGKDLLAHVIPLLVGDDRDNMIGNATETTLEGSLAPKYRYLQEYIDNA